MIEILQRLDDTTLQVIAGSLAACIGVLAPDVLGDYFKNRRRREIEKKWGKPNEFWRKDD